jgi:serine/threonine protein kinase
MDMPPRRKVGFLSDYKLQDTYLLKPDRKAGRPGLIDGFAPSGEPVLVREWQRGTKDNDGDLEHIWRHELRQLHRLAGYPGAADCIAHLYDAGEDPKGFYVVVALGQRQPLQAILDRSNSNHWLKQARLTTNRARIWANLKLLCKGLETLHAQGLLHRNLGAWSVLTAGGVEPDFQLTGFEWTMRLSSGELPHVSFGGTKRPGSVTPSQEIG